MTVTGCLPELREPVSSTGGDVLRPECRSRDSRDVGRR